MPFINHCGHAGPYPRATISVHTVNVLDPVQSLEVTSTRWEGSEGTITSTTRDTPANANGRSLIAELLGHYDDEPQGNSNNVRTVPQAMEIARVTTPVTIFKTEPEESPTSGTMCPSMDIADEVPSANSDEQTSDSMISHGFEVTGAGAETPPPYLVPFEGGRHQEDLDRYAMSLAGDNMPELSLSGSDPETLGPDSGTNSSDDEEEDLEGDYLRKKELEKKELELEQRIRDLWPFPGKNCPNIVRFIMDYEMGILDDPIEKLPPGMSNIIGKVIKFYLKIITTLSLVLIGQ